MAHDRGPARHGKVEARARRRAPAGGDDWPIFVLRSVADEQALRRRELVIDLDVVGPPVLRALERPFVLRPQTPRIDGEELIFVRALVREEVVRLVLHDRAADRAAVLVPAVIGL